jgi:DNA-binding transcriptional MerR regulator/transcriptional regulator with XRE-family HTH domain
MTEPDPREILDIATLERIGEELRLRDAADPDPRRAEVINDLRAIQDMLARRVRPDQDTTGDAALEAQLGVLLRELRAMELTSLGTTEARRVRAGATAGHVAGILDRHDQVRYTGYLGDAAAGEPSLLRVLLGAQLRRLRESRGISAHAAARAIRASESKISRIELGRGATREIDVRDLLTFYGADPTVRDQLLRLAEQSNRPSWWHVFSDILPDWFEAYAGMEAQAASIRVYEPQFVPGLLQTSQYAIAMLALSGIHASHAERHAMFRRERQRRFIEGKLKLWVVVEETALRRPVGSKEILRDQLRRLLSLSGTHNLTLQVIPGGTATHAVPSGFSILQFGEPDLPDVVYLEQQTSALYLDNKSDVDSYLLATEQLSAVSADPGETAQILAAVISQLDDELGTHHQEPGPVPAILPRNETPAQAVIRVHGQSDPFDMEAPARRGLVEPSVRAAHGSGSQRLYSFRDILILKVVKRLLDTGISLQQIRAAVQHLRDRGTEDLAQVTLMSDGISVYECTSADEVVDLLQGGQGVFGIALGRVWREVESDLAILPAGRAEDGFAAVDPNGSYGSGSAVGQDDLAKRRLRRTS